MLGRKKKTTRKNRLKKSIRQKRNRMMRRLLNSVRLVVLMGIILAVSALFMAGYAAVTSSEYFRTQAIFVSGQSRLSRELIIQQAGIRQGDNLLAVNLRLVRKRLMAHPWIASARVSREIPETVSIAVSEHVPLAVLDLGRKFLLNNHGRIFKEYGSRDPKDLPLVTGIAYGDISLGDDALSPGMTAILEVLNISKDKAGALSYGSIKEIRMDTEMGVTLYVWENRRKINLGIDAFAAKYERIKQLLPYLKRHARWSKFRAIDANNPNRIVVQL